MRQSAIAACVFLLGVGAIPLAAQEGAEPQTLSLGRAINVALANSPQLDAAEFGLHAANQRVREAWGTLMPDVTANASYQRNLKLQKIFLPAQFLDPNAPPGAVTPITVGSDNNWSASVTASQKLFEFGAFIGVGAAGRYKSLQQEIVRGTAQQVVSSVRAAYFNALLAQEQVQLLEQSIARVRATLEDSRARNRAGLASDYDVLRFEVQLTNLEANVEQARNQSAAAKRQLLVEMGLELETPIRLEGDLSQIRLDSLAANASANREILSLAGAGGMTDVSYDELIDVAYSKRSDLRQLGAQVELQQAQVGVERAEFFPKLSLFSNYNIQAQQDGSPDFFGGPNSRVTTAAAGVRVELPIFKGFGRAARLQQAQATMHQDEANLERAKLQARQDVHTMQDNVQEARHRAAAQAMAVNQAQRGFTIATAEYQQGVGSQLQVTDAEVALRESQFNYARAVYDYLTARAQLELALGLVPDKAGAAEAEGAP